MRPTLTLLTLLAAPLALAQAPAAVPAAAKPVPVTAKPVPVAAAGGKLDGAKLFMEKTCFSCHGKDAKTPILPEYPRLAGQGALYAERQMKDIKSGARSNGNTASMKGIMFLVNDEEIHALSLYLNSLK